jgi:hypothetical protein
MLIASPQNSIRVDNGSYRKPDATKHQTNWSTPGLPRGWDSSNLAQMPIAAAILNDELPMDGQRVTGFRSLAGQSYFAARRASVFANLTPCCADCHDFPVATNER